MSRSVGTRRKTDKLILHHKVPYKMSLYYMLSHTTDMRD